MLPACPFWKIAALVLLVIWYIFFNWETAEMDCFWHKTKNCFKIILKKTQDSAKKAANISKYP